MRIPRKKKKKIPKGLPYCYTPTSGMIYPEDGSLPYYTIKKCPFYQHKEDVEGWCGIYKHEILDQCKICNVR